MRFWVALLSFLCSITCPWVVVVHGERHRVAARKERQRAEQWLHDNPLVASFTPISSSSRNSRRLDRHPDPSSCPCSDLSLCRPITNVPAVREQEIFGFALSQGQDDMSYFNFSRVTTIAWASEAILCQAHEHGIRAIANIPGIDMKLILEPDYRTEWVQNVTHMVQSRYFDGVTFDYESPMDDASGPIAQAYVELINATKQSLSRHIHPNLQVTVCVAWSPDAIDGRNYPVQQLANVADALYVMDYDTQSQILYGPCIAAANAPYYGMIRGIDRYRQVGVPLDKLILGVPWYGYRYPCINDINAHHDEKPPKNFLCRIDTVPFRGIPCSDAAGRQFPYDHMVQLMIERNIRPEFDANQQAPYFTVYEETKASITSSSNSFTVQQQQQQQQQQELQLYQYWFDDPASLRTKYAWARQAGIRGVGPYAFYQVGREPHLQPFMQAMWSAFDVFLDSDDNNTSETKAF